MRISGESQTRGLYDDEPLDTGSTINDMLPPNYAVTLPALAIATKVNVLVYGRCYTLECARPDGVTTSRATREPF